MTVIYSIFLFFIGIILYYYKNGKYFLHYYLLWITCAPIFFSMIFKMDIEGYYRILAWASKLGDFALLDMLLNRKHRNDKYLKIILICFIIAMMYVLLLVLIREVSFILYLKYGLECFSIIAGISMFISRHSDKYSLYKLIRFIFISELFVGLIQVFFQSLNYKCAFSTNELLYVNGTFVGNNTYIEFITCLGFLVWYIEFKRKGKFSLSSLVEAVILVFLTIQTGVRMALVAMFIPYSYLILIYLKSKSISNRNIIKYIVFGFILLFPIVNTVNSYISKSSVSYTKDAVSATQRQAVLVSIILDNSYLIEHTTFGLSYNIVSLLKDNIVLGPGLFFKGHGYNGYSYQDGSSITDATFALFVGEFGITGLILFITMLIILLRKINLKKKGAIVLTIYLAFVSLTDNGLFAAINLYVVVSMIVLEKSLSFKKQNLIKLYSRKSRQ